MPKPRANAALVAESPSMKAILGRIAELPEGPSPVLIEGEPGSGRELIARLVHRHSSRAGRELISIKAGATPLEIFACPVDDHSQDSFQSAHAGTLLVRNISELGKRSQRTLSKALGDSARWDMRVLATTDPGLEAAVEAGMFYEPLFRKLRPTTIVLPPLRERHEDILPLANGLVQRLGREMGRKRLSISSRANDLLLRYPWPGNVAELKQVARRLVVRARGERVEASDVSAVLPTLATRAPIEDLSFEDLVQHKLGELLRRVEGYPLHSLHEEVMGLVEKPLLRLVLEHTGNNQLKAAEILGVSRNTLRRRLLDFGLVAARQSYLRSNSRSSKSTCSAKIGGKRRG